MKTITTTKNEWDRDVLANLIWVKVKRNLDDRDCFNGIYEDVMEDIDLEIVDEIDKVLENFEKGIFT